MVQRNSVRKHTSPTSSGLVVLKGWLIPGAGGTFTKKARTLYGSALMPKDSVLCSGIYIQFTMSEECFGGVICLEHLGKPWGSWLWKSSPICF